MPEGFTNCDTSQARRSVSNGHQGNRYQNPRPVDTQLAHAGYSGASGVEMASRASNVLLSGR